MGNNEPAYVLMSWEKPPKDKEGKFPVFHSVYGEKEDVDFIVKKHKEKGKSDWGFKINEFREFRVLEIPVNEDFGLQLPSVKKQEKKWKDIFDELEGIAEEISEEKGEENPLKSEK
jgi:hypothetical protein